MPIEITVPGSKSIANRALILSALSQTTTTSSTKSSKSKQTVLRNLPNCDDTKYLQEALKKLDSQKNLNTKPHTKSSYTKNSISTSDKSPSKPIRLYTGNAGTTTRFLTAYCTLLNKHVVINGDKRMRERPIKELITALKKLGANISCKNGCPPIEIKPQIPKGGTISLPGNISSQYLTALLLSAPQFTSKTTINIAQNLCSKPYINLTINLLKEFKINIKNNKSAQFQITPQSPISPKNYTTESDASSASYMGGFAALNPSQTILLKNIHQDSLQGDITFLKYLKKMGCKITPTKKGARIKGPKVPHSLKPLRTIDMNKTPDLVPTFATLAMFTKGKTTIKNVANLRIKETDRLKALENEIKKFGIKVETTKSSITIHGNPIHLKTITKRISIKTYNDHRIAMCFAIIRNKFPNLHIQNPKCVNKSYPTFWDDLKLLEQAQPKPSNIVLTGMRGSGKSQLGKILAKKLKYNFIDLDDEIEKLAKSPISKIVKKHGWKHFRNLEIQICKNIKNTKNTVIATGGGSIINPKNQPLLQKNNLVIYLKRSPQDCIKFIKNFSTRPSLTNSTSQLKEMQKIFKERHPIYQTTSNIIFKRTSSLEKDAEKIFKRITSFHKSFSQKTS